MERRDINSPFHYEEWLKILHRRNQTSGRHVIVHDSMEKVVSRDKNNRKVEQFRKKETSELWIG